MTTEANQRRECELCQSSWQGPGVQPTRCPRCGGHAKPLDPGVWREDLVTSVIGLEYSFVRHVGVLYMPHCCCSDMVGIIALFMAIDPQVSAIEAFDDAGYGTSYRLNPAGKWTAEDVTPPATTVPRHERTDAAPGARPGAGETVPLRALREKIAGFKRGTEADPDDPDELAEVAIIQKTLNVVLAEIDKAVAASGETPPALMGESHRSECRDVCHDLLQQAWSLLDPEAHPELDAAITAELTACQGTPPATVEPAFKDVTDREIADFVVDAYVEGGTVDNLRRNVTNALREIQQQEVCICAAIRLDDGYIVRGHRHDDCIQTIVKLQKAGRNVGEHPAKQSAQGFVTSRGRFVDRKEGADLQRAAGLVPDKVTTLFSEDLY